MQAVLQTAVLVGMGGAIGASLRYLSVVGATALLGVSFPFGTLFVNVVGSLLMGVFLAILRQSEMAQPIFQAFFMTGILGGFTTFSAFSLDVMATVEKGQPLMAVLYVTASVLGGVIALVAGYSVMRSIA